MLKVYLTDLQAYNEGNLSGKWIELPMSQEDLNSEIKEVLEEGAVVSGFGDTHEEIFITDFEWTIECNLIEVNEYSSLSRLNEQLEELESYDEEDLKRISYLTEHRNYDLETAIEKYEEVVIYENSTLEEVVEEYISQTIDLDDLPSIISNNIDYKSIAYDFEISGEYDKIEHDIYHYVD